MSSLTIRAEQALIGAMLAGGKLPPEFEQLQPESFGHRSLRQIYTTILDLRDYHQGDELTRQVAAQVYQPGVDAEWLQQLRDSCPSTAHIASYARMVQVNGFRRTMVEHSERITTTSATGRPGVQARASVTGMALALQRQAEAYRAFTLIDEQEALKLWQAPAHEYQQKNTPRDDDRSDKEDALLADLLAHPEQALKVSRYVQPDTFTSEQRREIFITLASLATEGESIDEIIVLWEAEKLRAEADLYGPEGSGNAYRGEEISTESNAAYLDHLAAMSVTAGTAIIVGHELVTADVKASLARSAAEAAERQAANQSLQNPPQIRQVEFDPGLIPPLSVDTSSQPTIEW